MKDFGVDRARTRRQPAHTSSTLISRTQWSVCTGANRHLSHTCLARKTSCWEPVRVPAAREVPRGEYGNDRGADGCCKVHRACVVGQKKRCVTEKLRRSEYGQSSRDIDATAGKRQSPLTGRPFACRADRDNAKVRFAAEARRNFCKPFAWPQMPALFASGAYRGERASQVGYLIDDSCTLRVLRTGEVEVRVIRRDAELGHGSEQAVDFAGSLTEAERLVFEENFQQVHLCAGNEAGAHALAKRLVSCECSHG